MNAFAWRSVSGFKCASLKQARPRQMAALMTARLIALLKPKSSSNFEFGPKRKPFRLLGFTVSSSD
jgi:hypothetical protein